MESSKSAFTEFQVGWFVLIPLATVWILLSVVFFFEFGRQVSLVSYLVSTWVIAGIAVVFYGMETTLDDSYITISFGIGLMRKRIPLGKINSLRQVKNRWFYGLGIRTIPGGVLYSIHGLHAVELTLTDSNRLIRIGTQKGDLLERTLMSKNAGGEIL